MDIWTYETEHRTWARITSDAADDIFPLWSPDDSHLVFSSSRKGGSMDLYQMLLAAPGSDELLLSTPQRKFPMTRSSRHHAIAGAMDCFHLEGRRLPTRAAFFVSGRRACRQQS